MSYERVQFHLYFDGAMWQSANYHVRHRKDIWETLSAQQGFDYTLHDSEELAQAAFDAEKEKQA